MNKLIVTEFISLDGVIEEPMWTGPYFSDEIGQRKDADYFGAAALLQGGTTHAGHAAAWPTREGDFADRINAMPKYVVSRTADTASWANTTRVEGDLVAEITRLKESLDGDILVDGSSQLVELLLREGLVDQLDLLVFPVVVGGGVRLFKDGTQVAMDLVSAETLPNGVVAQRYVPAAAPAEAEPAA